MSIKDLRGKMVAVLGYGQEGQATAAYLQKHQIPCVLFDQRPFESFSEQEQAGLIANKTRFVFGPDAFNELIGFEVAFRSPGIPLNLPELLKAQTKGLKLTSQTKFFFENCPSQVIGVTGTKGKGTTSTLIYKILQVDGRGAYLTGNIGQMQALEILDQLKASDKVVFELSSFQLQDLNISPHIGVVLMVTSDHLDYHKDEVEYHAAKEPITKFQKESDFAIINADFEVSNQIGELGQGKKVFFSRKRKLETGVWVENNEIKFSFQGKMGTLLPTTNIALIGKHNLENICAATAACLALEVNQASITQVIKSFKGLEHRLEFVKDIAGIKYYNDSYSTTPDTAIAAINSFSSPLILILGGSDKKANFTSLASAIAGANNIKKIVLIGDSASKIDAALEKAQINSVPITRGAVNMAEVIAQANEGATAGDVVLLSPACASFGMFENYKQRGEQFKLEVAKLNA